MDAAKLRLSQEELALVSNAQWILTKNTILTKTIGLFAHIQSIQNNELKSAESYLQASILSIAPKISKGENYLGLPYVVLDQPRFFQKEDAFAIRHLFWWGNFFSSSFYLAGIYKIIYQEQLLTSYEVLKANNSFICINEDPWQHHFEDTNYRLIADISEEEYKQAILTHPFIKIAMKFALTAWESAEKKFLDSFRLYLALLH